MGKHLYVLIFKCPKYWALLLMILNIHYENSKDAAIHYFDFYYSCRSDKHLCSFILF